MYYGGFKSLWVQGSRRLCQARASQGEPHRDDMVFKFYNKKFFLGEGGYEAAPCQVMNWED